MGNDRSIQREYQLKSAIQFCFVFLIAVLISSVFIYLKIAETVGKDYYNVLYTLDKTKELLFQTVILSVLFQILIGTLCTIIVLVFVTHKVAGPFFRFEKFFESIHAGDLTVAVNLRDKDQFKVLAEQVNKMIMSLRDKIKGVKGSYSQLDDVSVRLKQYGEDKLTEADFREIVKSLDEETSKLKGSLSQFNT